MSGKALIILSLAQSREHMMALSKQWMEHITFQIIHPYIENNRLTIYGLYKTEDGFELQT